MTSSGGGFESGPDFIAAKIAFDVDSASVQTVAELSQVIDRLRTSTEAGARSGASFVGYVQQITAAAKQATEAHRDLAAQLERTAEMQMRGAAGGSGTSQALTSSRLAPGGYVDPYAGMSAGTGGQRGLSPSDAQNHIDPIYMQNPRHYINAQAGRNNVTPADFPPVNLDEPALRQTAGRIADRDAATRRQQQATSPGQTAGGGTSGLPAQPDTAPSGGGLARYSGYGRLAANIANEMAPGGGSWAGLGKVLHSGLKGAANHMDASAKGTGAEPAADANEDSAENSETHRSGLGKWVKRAGGAVGLGLGGLAAFEKGGAMYQGYKNMGMIRGGGAGEGFGDEASIRTMALNPFLTTEQARSIVMAGLTEGYSGKQYDDATKFMADNLKNMNISVSDSVQLLRKNVNEGGQSIEGLGKSLDKLKDMSKTGAMDLPDLQRAFMNTSGALIRGGSSGQAAGEAATESLGMFEDDQTLKGDMSTITSDAAGGSARGGALLEAYSGTHVAGLDPSKFGAYESRHGGNMADITAKAINKMTRQLFASPASRKIDSYPFLNMLSLWQQQLAMMSPNAPEVNDSDAARKMVIKILGGNPDESSGSTDAQLSLSAPVDDKVMAQAVNQQNPQPQVVDHGQGSPANGSPQQAQSLMNGGATWRPAGSQGPGYALAQTPAAGSPGAGTAAPAQTHVNFAPATIQVNVKSDGSATVSPNPVALTPNVIQAQQGYGGATMNSGQPGDGYPNPIQN